MRSFLPFLALLQVPRAQASESSPLCSVLPSGTVTFPGSDSKFSSTCTETPASFSYEIDLTIEQTFGVTPLSYTLGPINIGFKAEFDACASGGASMGLYYKCEVIQTVSKIAHFAVSPSASASEVGGVGGAGSSSILLRFRLRSTRKTIFGHRVPLPQTCCDGTAEPRVCLAELVYRGQIKFMLSTLGCPTRRRNAAENRGSFHAVG